MPGSIRELFAYWWSGGRSRSAVVWKMVLMCLMWCIWRERNARCFEDSSRSFEEFTHYILFTLYTWTAGWLAPTVISFPDFLSCFSFPSLASPCILPVYFGLRSSAPFIYILTYQKKLSIIKNVMFFNQRDFNIFFK
jgi:hypothetical protein